MLLLPVVIRQVFVLSICFLMTAACRAVGPRLDKVRAHAPAPACTPKCFGYRNLNPQSTALLMQLPAVSRSRHLTVCDGVTVCASVIVQDIRCLGYRNLLSSSVLPLRGFCWPTEPNWVAWAAPGGVGFFE